MRLLSFRSGLARKSAKRPIGICFAIDRLGRAGTESQLLALIRHLDRDRFRPTLCVLDGSDAATRELLPPHCPTIDLGLRRLSSPAAVIAASRLAAFWRQHRVDMVQSYFLDSTYFAVPLSRLCGIHCVVRVRNNVGYWLTPRHRWLGKIVGRLATTLTNSDDAKQAIHEAERLPLGRVHVIENGVDVDRFDMMRPPDTSAAVVRIGAVANLRPIKNIDGLVRVAKQVCRNDPRVVFEIAGDGPERPRLEELIRANGLEDRFLLRGSVADIPGFLRTLDVAVLASHSESMSNALLEYMAAGRAIIATDVGSNRTLVRPNREGLIIAAADDQQLMNSIHQLLSNPTLARSLGAAARSRVEVEYDRSAMVRRFQDFYESLFT